MFTAAYLVVLFMEAFENAARLAAAAASSRQSPFDALEDFEEIPSTTTRAKTSSEEVATTMKWTKRSSYQKMVASRYPDRREDPQEEKEGDPASREEELASQEEDEEEDDPASREEKHASQEGDEEEDDAASREEKPASREEHEEEGDPASRKEEEPASREEKKDEDDPAKRRKEKPASRNEKEEGGEECQSLSDMWADDAKAEADDLSERVEELKKRLRTSIAASSSSSAGAASSSSAPAATSSRSAWQDDTSEEWRTSNAPAATSSTSAWQDGTSEEWRTTRDHDWSQSGWVDGSYWRAGAQRFGKRAGKKAAYYSARAHAQNLGLDMKEWDRENRWRINQ